MSSFSSILIANRGEIACRIMRSAHAMGYRTVAVYSDVDANAPHVAAADAAIRIGTGPVGDSYLDADKILAAARDSGAGAIHPGYGFLSENAAFAAACAKAGFVFIGPSPQAIEIMGNKAKAKRHMHQSGVPCVPGYEGDDQDEAALMRAAEGIGVPLMVKAAAGGGGRGMRLVETTEELATALRMARSEAEQAFGSGELILEKYIEQPRHVEVQVFADSQGNTIHLGERDCSIQRRHQKVIEEAPCPIMTPALRERMGAAAVAAAKSIDYCGAGTVEFLLDAQGAFYFLEMNTRLQVEHPVTEAITGLDLVELQIRVARGEALALRQEDIAFNGHAMEARLYAEDTAQSFLPTSGPVDLWCPASGPGVRIDSGICSGQDISPHYDPMIAKIIAHGPNREVARMRLLGALQDTVLFGVSNNQRFLADCLQKASFIAGKATTGFIAEEFPDGAGTTLPSPADAAVAAALDVHLACTDALRSAVIVSEALRHWTSADPLVSHRHFRFAGQDIALEIRPLARRRDHAQFQVSCGEQAWTIVIMHCEGNSVPVEIDGQRQVCRFLRLGAGRLHVMIGGRASLFIDRIPLAGKVDEHAGSGLITAPMHGVVLDVQVAAEDSVIAGQALLVLEAMKMQHEITAPAAGTVRRVHCHAGAQVAADDVLIEIDTGDPS